MSTSAERPTSTPTRGARSVLEYVTIPNCRDCSRLEQLLADVRGDYPGVEVREIQGHSERGRQLSIERGVLRFPVVLLNGDIIAIESISEPDLRSSLDRATAE